MAKDQLPKRDPSPPTENAGSPPAAPPPEEKKPTPEELERSEHEATLAEGRKRFARAYVKNHGWDDVAQPLTVEQVAEIERHPYWKDPTPWLKSVKDAEEADRVAAAEKAAAEKK